MKSQRQTFGAGASPAKTSALQESGQDSQASAAALPSPSLTLLSSESLGGSCLKMYQGSSIPMGGLTLAGSSVKWSAWGIASAGGCLMPATGVLPSGAGESLSLPLEIPLLAVLEPIAPQRFCLSAKAAAGILARAQRKGKRLPAALQEALQLVAADFKPQAALVRRLSPLECERLMGWPDGWTLSAGWIPLGRKRTVNCKPETGKTE